MNSIICDIIITLYVSELEESVNLFNAQKNYKFRSVEEISENIFTELALRANEQSVHIDAKISCRGTEISKLLRMARENKLPIKTDVAGTVISYNSRAFLANLENYFFENIVEDKL